MTFATKVIATFGLALLAVLGNIINLPLFFGVHFIFGSVAVMLAIRLVGFWPAVWVALAVALAAFGVARVAQAKVGGQTGDVLGATQQVSEAVALCAFAALA